MIAESDWRRAMEALAASDSVIVACHVNPDGDALGSMLALGSYLSRIGKKVGMSIGSTEISIPPHYAFLPGSSSIATPVELNMDPQVFVAIDCGDASRLGILLPKFESVPTKINIDHHISNEGFGDIDLIDVEAASSSELAYELIRKMGGIPNSDEATCLYTGIVTDTGRFQHSSTSPTTLRIAADLREIGVDHEKVAVEVYESASFVYLHVLGLVLSRARLEDGLVWSWIDQHELGALDLDQTEHFIDVLRSVSESKVAVLLKQLPKKSYKVSLRSRGQVDVAEIAVAFGGGGHARAAGFEMTATPEAVVRAIQERIN